MYDTSFCNTPAEAISYRFDVLPGAFDASTTHTAVQVHVVSSAEERVAHASAERNVIEKQSTCGIGGDARRRMSFHAVSLTAENT